MARTDAIVLGAGIVGTSIALHLVRRGLSVALVDRRRPGEETSYGNTGVIGSTVYPASFPRALSELVRVALKRAPQAPSWLAYLLRSAYAFLEAGRQLMQPRTLLLLIPTALYMLVYAIYLDAMRRRLCFSPSRATSIRGGT